MEKNEQNSYRCTRLYFQKNADIITQRFGTREELLETPTSCSFLLLLTWPKATIIFWGNKGHKLIKEKQSLTVKSGLLALALESCLQTDFSCFFLLIPFKYEEISKNPIDPLMRGRTLKLSWDFKVFENILHIVARMEKHSDENIGRIFLKTHFHSRI